MKTAMFMTVIGLVGTFMLGTVTAADPPPTVEDVRELMEKQPLTAETWPTWRDYYVRLYYAYDVGEPKEIPMLNSTEASVRGSCGWGVFICLS